MASTGTPVGFDDPGGRVPFDGDAAFHDHRAEQFALHEAHLNPQLPRVLRTLGFDRTYVRGEGPWLWDDAGERYLDLLSGFGVFALGRSHRGVKAALHQALDLDLPSMVQIDCALFPGLLAEALCERSHDAIQRVYFCNSGAEAVEAAVKFARAFTKRARVLYCSHAYHGLTLGALSLNGGTSFREGFGPLLADVEEVPFGDLTALHEALARGDVAAFIAEPIQGKGVYEAPASYWQGAERACREAGAMFVMDEVQTGIGRTGSFWCHEQFGVTPDLICASKALSGGYVPVAATLARDDVFRSVYSSMDRALVHSTTFKQNQLAMVAGLATLSAIDDEELVEHARRMGEVWKERSPPRALRAPHRRARQGPDDRPRVRGALDEATPWHVADDRAHPTRLFRADHRASALPPAPDPDAGRRGQREHHQAPAGAHRRRG